MVVFIPTHMVPLLLKMHIWNVTLRWRHNDHAGISNHQPHGCLLNRLFRRKSKKTSKLRVTGLCAGNSPGTGEFPAQMASYAENVSIWWRHHDQISSPMMFVWMCRVPRAAITQITKTLGSTSIKYRPATDTFVSDRHLTDIILAAFAISELFAPWCAQ